MVHINIPNYFNLSTLRKRQGLSERSLAENSAVSRGSIRKLEARRNNIELLSLAKLAAFFKRKAILITVPEQILPQYSTIATAMLVERDGFESWKLHYFNFVDEFRRTLDPRLILLPPHANFNPQLKALLAAIVHSLCKEVDMTVPSWALKRYFLSIPWFISEMESLKASAITESPLAFRNNNIFVHSNFLSRA